MISFVLLQALSRYREFAADRGSAIITGRPSALISALMKISGRMQQIPQRDLRAASGELAAFYIFPPKAKQTVADAVLHPPAARGADRGAPAARGPAPGHRLMRDMGFLDVLTGKRKLASPAPDRLFAMSTAYVTFETSCDHLARDGGDRVPAAGDRRLRVDRPRHGGGRAARPRPTAAPRSRRSDDSYGFRWLILRGKGFDDLVVGINAVSSALEAGGYGERVLCAVFAFEDASKRPLYWIYNYKRGAFYPFVPGAGEQQRDNERELVLKAQIGAELPGRAGARALVPAVGDPDLSPLISLELGPRR